MNILKRVFDKRFKTLPTIADWGNKVIFDNQYPYSDLLSDSFTIRYKYIKQCFPILSHEFITDLSNFCKDYKNIVDVGCGRGWMSYWLKKYGVDLNSVDDMEWPSFENYFDFIIKDDAVEYVKNNDCGLIIMSWPNYADPFAYNIWNSMRESQTLIYIGESYGCTADDDFHKAVEDSEIETSMNDNFRSFWGIHDAVYVYKKQK